MELKGVKNTYFSYISICETSTTFTLHATELYNLQDSYEGQTKCR